MCLKWQWMTKTSARSRRLHFHQYLFLHTVTANYWIRPTVSGCKDSSDSDPTVTTSISLNTAWMSTNNFLQWHIRPWEATGFIKCLVLRHIWAQCGAQRGDIRHTAHNIQKSGQSFFFFINNWVLSFTFSLYHSGMSFHFAENTSMPAAAVTATCHFLFS